MSIQDFTYILDPGAKEYQPIGEADYIFVRFADRPIDIQIDNQTVTLENGAEYESKHGLFSKFVISNPDPDNTAIVKLAIGTDRFRTRIISGDITTTPGIRTGDGSVIPDTRKKLKLDVIPVPGTGITENFGDTVETFFNAGTDDWLNVKIPNVGGVYPPDAVCFNPKLHNYPLALVRAKTTNLTYAISFDVFTGRIVRSYGRVDDLGQPEGIAVYGDQLYQANDYGTRGIYRRNSGGGWDLVVELPRALDLTILENGNFVVLTGSNQVTLVSNGGQVLATASTVNGNLNHIAIGPGQSIYAFSSANYPLTVWDQNLENRQELGILDADYPTFIYGAYMIESSSTGRLYARALETTVDLLAGRAYLECEHAWLGPRPGAFEAMRSTAEITVTNAETGNPTVEGELIRLVMEWYLGGPVPDTYMDLVHAVRIQGSTNYLGDRFPPIEIESNGQTLLAAKVPDHFRAIFPLTVELTIDQRAEL